MIVTLNKNTCIVTREWNDPHFHSGGWSSSESTFLYHVLKELKDQGYDVIKKRMWKDGHMVDNTQQYIRSRSWKKDGDFFILNNSYSIFDAGDKFNKDGQVILDVFHWEEL